MSFYPLLSGRTVDAFIHYSMGLEEGLTKKSDTLFIVRIKPYLALSEPWYW